MGHVLTKSRVFQSRMALVVSGDQNRQRTRYVHAWPWESCRQYDVVITATLAGGTSTTCGMDSARPNNFIGLDIPSTCTRLRKTPFGHPARFSAARLSSRSFAAAVVTINTAHTPLNAKGVNIPGRRRAPARRRIVYPGYIWMLNQHAAALPAVRPADDADTDTICAPSRSCLVDPRGIQHQLGLSSTT
ncbi:hypothetical protein BDZ89DRAFT_530677 [Hymenopellis radicata]|nr:hypothetical protein BDZ89DRAFT_530677 [Hymenopellis radicata]